MITKLSSLAIALALFSSCGTDSADAYGESGESDSTEMQSSEGAEFASHEAHVQCGCSIPSVGVCGDYIEVEGEMLGLVYPEGMDLGPMPFCGKDDLMATVDGTVRAEEFVATAFALKE